MTGVEKFRIDLRKWFGDLKKSDKHDNRYRQVLVIPRGAYKGLAWGMAWSAERVLGPEDPDTKAAWKTVQALLRLDTIQEKRLITALRVREGVEKPICRCEHPIDSHLWNTGKCCFFGPTQRAHGGRSDPDCYCERFLVNWHSRSIG